MSAEKFSTKKLDWLDAADRNDGITDFAKCLLRIITSNATARSALVLRSA